MEIVFSQKGETAHFEIKGEIDELGAETLRNRFREINKSSINELAFDFGKVDYIGSSGIGVLLLMYKDLATVGGTIRIDRVNREIYNLLMDLDIDTIIKINKA